MSQPQAYERQTDFTERDGDDTDHPALNQELDAAALSINQIRANLTLIQRDDGGLKNGVVTADSLAPNAFSAVLVNVNLAVGEAQTAAQSALTSATTANNARDQSALSATAAQTSQAAAALNAGTASSDAIAANASKVAAAASRAAALVSENSADTSEAASLVSQNASAVSAAAALASKNAAAVSAADALASKNTAGTSATTATDQAVIATAKAAAAVVQADAAAASALASAANAPLLLTGVAGTNTVTANTTPATTVYLAGQLFKFIPVNSNTGAMTVNVNGVGPVAIKKNGTETLASGDVKAGQAYLLMRDLVGNFQLSGGSGGGATAGGVFYECGQVLLDDYTIPANTNAISGQLQIALGKTLTISPGAVWSMV